MITENKLKILCLVLLVTFCIASKSTDLVPNKDTAIKIAKIIIETRLKQSLDSLNIYDVTLMNDSIWAVTITPKHNNKYSKSDSIIEIVSGGVFYMEINKKNCQIDNFIILK